jgi:hypothetical protein
MTKACAYRCPHCYQRMDDGKEVEIEHLKQVVREMQDMGVCTFDIEGGLGQLIAFLARLEGESLAPFGINNLTIKEAAGGFTLNIEVLAYARQPAEQATPASGSSKSSATPTPSKAGGGKAAPGNGG